ncbi:MAG: ATP phosphoribosyltransferase regulatory subunit [Sandaracinaceae bacterium]|nr:ATP phosphoribosyltransferase regulatory subunit [Sandaracinaceae bacterium]
MTEPTSIPLAPPAGMRDLLPPEADARAWLGSQLVRCFARWGYQRVTTPPFEHAEVIERGLDALDRRDLLRFVDPSTGEVALLRPDITPQIARIVATRLGDRPPPHRLAYAASVVRQRRGRARRQRVLAQAGVECIGLAHVEADAEVIRLAAAALAEVGLAEYRIELGLVSLARDALTRVRDAARPDVEAALLLKDTATLKSALAGEDAAIRAALVEAASLYGEPREVLPRARKVWGDAPALAELARVVARLDGLPLVVDLGEIRGMTYYTGVSFTLLAEGPGEPVGSGGRYDGLMERFGAPAPATGFGIDLANLEWALHAAGRPVTPAREARFVVAGGRGEAREALAARLRAAGLVAAVVPVRAAGAALDYARSWGYDAAVVCDASGAEVHRLSDGARARLDRDLSRAGAWARS